MPNHPDLRRDGTTPEERPNASLTPKCLANQNTRLLLRMIDEQAWIHRNTVIWHKPNPMPSSVRDRLSNTYEPVYMLVKSKRYCYDLDAVRIPHCEYEKERRLREASRGLDSHYDTKAERAVGRFGKSSSIIGTKNRARLYATSAGKNPGDMWTIPTAPFTDAHFATFPPDLVKPMILSSCPEWVCTKCGRARTRVSKVSHFDGGPKWRRTPGNRAALGDLSAKSVFNTGLGALHHTLGWTRCNCQAPFTGGIILDPFGGSGTVGMVAKELNRHYILIDLSPVYCDMARKRIADVPEHLPFEAPDVAERSDDSG